MYVAADTLTATAPTGEWSQGRRRRPDNMPGRRLDRHEVRSVIEGDLPVGAEEDLTDDGWIDLHFLAGRSSNLGSGPGSACD